MLTFRDLECAHMHEHTILQIVSDQPPPFATDPQIVEWATHVSNHIHKGTEVKLAKKA